MRKNIEKISLWTIYIGTAVILAVPLFVDNRFFFPFISTKIFLFRLVLEIMLLGYLALNLVSSEYRPRINFLTIIVVLFILTATLSSFLGGRMQASFWGDIERGEGIILWLFGLAFFLILTSTFRKKETWHHFLDISIGVNWLLMLFGLGQVFKISSLLASSGSRVDATLGNAAFYGTYLLFHIGFAVYLFTQKFSRGWKVYYAATALVGTFLLIATQTRGAVLGLAVGSLFAALLFFFKFRENPRVRKASAALALIIVAAGASLFVFRDKSFVKDNFLLKRLSSISLRERTAETRLITWQAAWTGWQEKFILGHGLDNFDRVFNKNFPPRIYEDAGSQVWFDRAHNVIFDKGVTTGIVGLVLFLAVLIYPAYYLLRYSEDRLAAIIFSGFILAYLVQDLFVFESITAYLLLFFTLAFFAAMWLPAGLNVKGGTLAWGAVLALYALALPWLLQKTVFEPARLNIYASTAGNSDPRNDDFFMVVDRWKKAIETPNYGRREYRLQFIEFVDQQLANVGEVVPAVKPILAYTDEQAQKQIDEDPDDAKAYLLAMRHYNYTYASLPDQKIARVEKALSFFPKLAELSPTRPHVFQEAGYSHLYLYRIYLEQKNTAKANEHLETSRLNLRKAVDLNPAVVESYVNLIMLNLNSGQDDEIEKLIAEMDNRQVRWRTEEHLSKLVSLSVSNNKLYWIGFFSEQQVKLNPGNVDGWINLAVFYATNGNRRKAIEVAEEIKKFGGQYVEEAEKFVENVNKGAYEKPR